MMQRAAVPPLFCFPLLPIYRVLPLCSTLFVKSRKISPTDDSTTSIRLLRPATCHCLTDRMSILPWILTQRGGRCRVEVKSQSEFSVCLVVNIRCSMGKWAEGFEFLNTLMWIFSRDGYHRVIGTRLFLLYSTWRLVAFKFTDFVCLQT